MRHVLVFLAMAPFAFPQGLTNSSLNGRYVMRHAVAVTTTGTSFSDLRSVNGNISFDGTGGYTLTGQQMIGAGAPAAFSATGTYSVAGNGVVSLSNPQRPSTTINARMSSLGVIGSSTEAGSGIYDLFLAFPAPGSGAVLGGPFWVGSVEFVAGATPVSRTTFFSLAGTSGNFSPVVVNGQASNLGRRPVTQTVTGATYTMGADGNGTANFPLPAGEGAVNRLLSGGKTIAVSGDGNFLIMSSTVPGSHDFFVGIKATAAVSNNAFKDLYWSGGLQLNGTRANSFAGSANSAGTGVALLTRRVRAPEGAVDFTGVNRYGISADGSGLAELNKFAVGANGNAFVSSGTSLVDSNNYELYLGFKAPAIPAAPGPFLNPYGAVNAGSFAPPVNPTSPGQFLTLFGANLAASTQTAAAAPFPTQLGGVQVLINDRPSPIYLVSPGQLSLLVPQSTSGGTASIVAVVNGARSNAISVPVARTAPGMFSAGANGIGAGAILKPNFSLVTAQNPARRGDTILLFLTGLGEVSPAVVDGAVAPANPLSLVTGSVNVYIGGEKAQVTFKGLSPGLVGLYQLNVVIPVTAPTGAAVPLGIETADAFHDQVDVAIAP